MTENKDVNVVLSNNSISTAYIPTDCIELYATLKVLQHYSEKANGAVSVEECERYCNII